MSITNKTTRLVLAALMCLGVTGCNKQTNTEETASVTTSYADFAEEVTRTISQFGDNPDVGNRSCGSDAEQQAADYIEKTMKEIGLQNVTMDEFTADTWSFNKGRIEMTDAEGNEQTLLLGGFATNMTYSGEVEVVDVGRGTMEDYEGLDVTGKVVLFDINQREDWWINVPAMEAYNRGALAALACNDAGYAYYDNDTIGSQDFCGPAKAATFSLSMNSAAALRALMDANDGVAKVTLDVDSVVEENGTSQNVWGEIPGKTDEVIYFFAHYDGYYHSFYDDASGVGSILSIAKRMVEEGYEPDKTIRFVAHGAEEWGKTDTEYDWSMGAYHMITDVHPEWRDNGFAILNIDGMYPVQGHTEFTVASTQELVHFVENSSSEAFADGTYQLDVSSGTTCWTEDFSYVRAGVPSIVASHSEPSEVYHGPAYHSSMDNEVLGIDKNAWEKQITLFYDYAKELDGMAVRPMDFALRFKELQEEYAGEQDLGVEALLTAAESLEEKITSLNEAYAEAVAQGDSEKSDALRAEGMALNEKMTETFRLVAKGFLAFDWEDNTILPFVQTANNIEGLESAIAAIQDGKVEEVNDALSGVDFNWYAISFSKDTYEYLLDKMYHKSTNTWGEGMIRFDGENLWDVIHSDLTDSAAQKDALDVLEAALSRQKDYFAQTEAQMVEDIAEITAQLQAMTAE